MASVSGILMVNVVPRPRIDLTSMVPPIWSILARTTSMPTPRPETLVILSTVEKPAVKMKFCTCASVILSTSASEATPTAMALALMRSRSRPRPSSETSMMMWPPSWQADRRMVPRSGFPAASRCAGVSRPWSAELRTM